MGVTSKAGFSLRSKVRSSALPLRSLQKMSTAARVLQAVKPHVPLIKFPNRSRDAATTLSQAVSHPQQQQQTQAQSMPRGPSLQDTDFLNLPKKYQRQPISPEEMAYIERGGPE